MVRCGVLVGLFLLSVFSPAAWAQIGNLRDIINFLQANYGGGGQFAVAINVPASKCAAGVRPDQNFLPNDDAQKARVDMAGRSKVYRGQQLIGAKPKPIPGTTSNYHSEYLLLIQSNPPATSPDDPLIGGLLRRNPSGCLIFYTFNSPCVGTCSTPNRPYSIIPALNRWFMNHGGPKAFVFGQVWKHDVNKPEWEANMREVNARVPLYRCYNAGCFLCVDNNNVINARCTY